MGVFIIGNHILIISFWQLLTLFERSLIIDEIHAVSNGKRGVHLSLSVERLMNICGSEPVRIGLSATQKPLERIAAFLGGQKYDVKTARFNPGPVTIVDCGGRKKMDLKVGDDVTAFIKASELSILKVL